jgi:hypothetical protein
MYKREEGLEELNDIYWKPNTSTLDRAQLNFRANYCLEASRQLEGFQLLLLTCPRTSIPSLARARSIRDGLPLAASMLRALSSVSLLCVTDCRREFEGCFLLSQQQ